MYVSAGPKEGTVAPEPGKTCNWFTHQFGTDPAKDGQTPAGPCLEDFARSALTLWLLDCGEMEVPKEG